MSTTFWIQFLGVVFGTAMLYFTYVLFRRKELTKQDIFFWAGAWILIIAIALKPGALDIFIDKLNFYRRLDFFVVVGFFILLLLAFFNYSTVKKLERKLENYVRQEALREQEKLSGNGEKP